VDVLFAELFRLPMAREREIYYAALLMEITKLAPQNVAPTLGRGIRWIYERLEGMRGEIGGRFSGWFAVHLSNFGFTYKWEEWYCSLKSSLSSLFYFVFSCFPCL
jgi:nuclear cap-binding protein subunit 1